ncbi:hypothetical protein [Dyella caseinilytica]|uniref:Interferon-induced transmembrane protein n=1 Tax=Dyella caseinilytica TaxID=1849581 RepID=A0ABX7GV29_9GAMM|nr:hypothetical protein [Dyella caseinilytica]QRN53908.1 hypothetical protein ISN74_00350 [Dyella caseinilytica]GFZ90044.1 hypothetical protein GCM10011408_06420 [Dyella caseinilytica]
MKTPDEFARMMSEKDPNIGKRPEGSFTISQPKEQQKLGGFEYFWAALPLLVLVIGGAIGGLFAALAVTANFAIFRSTKSRLYKYSVSTCVTLGTVILWYVVALLLMVIFPGLKHH